MSILIRGARVLTLSAGARPRRGAAMSDLGVLPRSDVLVEGDTIAAVAHTLQTVRATDHVIEANGRVLMPGFVDCHTHACYAGDRLDEWDMRRKGASYLDILSAGGGIISTVRAVRAATPEALEARLRSRLVRMLGEGTTTVEVKSGYGLTRDDELKMLRAIRACTAPPRASTEPGPASGLAPASNVAPPARLPTVVPTALLGHFIDPETPDFVERTLVETLPGVHAEFPGIAVDAFCEQSAWSLADCVRLFERAAGLAHPVRVHADQFNSLGMIREAVRLGAASVDHLEASGPEDLAVLAASPVIGVVLPCCGFHLDGRYANGRALVDAGGALAVATNLNPGSAPCSSMPMAIALAVRHCGLSPAEAIVACTVNAATLLGLADRGTIDPGRRADLIMLRHSDERMLAYEFGGDPVEVVIAGGEIVRG